MFREGVHNLVKGEASPSTEGSPVLNEMRNRLSINMDLLKVEPSMRNEGNNTSRNKDNKSLGEPD